MKHLQAVLLGLSIIMGLGGVAGLIGAFYLLPYKVEAVEKRVNTLANQRDADHELLTRIEERIINMQKSLEKK